MLSECHFVPVHQATANRRRIRSRLSNLPKRNQWAKWHFFPTLCISGVAQRIRRIDRFTSFCPWNRYRRLWQWQPHAFASQQSTKAYYVSLLLIVLVFSICNAQNFLSEAAFWRCFLARCMDFHLALLITWKTIIKEPPKMVRFHLITIFDQ